VFELKLSRDFCHNLASIYPIFFRESLEIFKIFTPFGLVQNRVMDLAYQYLARSMPSAWQILLFSHKANDQQFM